MRPATSREGFLERVSVRTIHRRTDVRTLRVLDWDYVYDTAALDRFERRHDAVVEVQTVPNSATAMERLRTDETLDLVALGNYAVPEAIAADLLQPLAVDRLESYAAVFDELKRPYFEVDGQVYATPRSFGQTPLCYRTDRLTRPMSWTVVQSGSSTPTCFRDDAQLAGLYAAVLSGRELTTEACEAVATDQLVDEFTTLLEPAAGLWATAAESQALFDRLDPVGAGPLWRFAARRLQRAGAPVEVVRPEAGTKAWFIQFARPAASSADELAAAFIDAWYDWLGWESLMRRLDIPIPTAAVFDQYDVDRATYGFDDFAQFIEQPALSAAAVDRYTDAWTRAKAATGHASTGDDE